MRLLDLFCGAGGAAMGYYRGGFTEIVGIDIERQSRYPFDFIQADALAPPVRLEDFDAIHASPPCQHYSLFSRNIGTYQNHPALIDPTRDRLKAAGVPYIIENVEHARWALRNPIMLCGSSFGLKSSTGLGLRRHRLFECSFAAWPLPCAHGYEKDSIGVYGHGTPQWFRKKHGRNARLSEWKEAMQIDWMTREELTEAIPPAMTEYLGAQLIQHLERAA